MNRIFRIFVFIAVSALLVGCGIYSFSPGGKSSIKSISVAQFENETIEVGLSSSMTDLVVDAFISDGNLKVVGENSADAILIGTMKNYSRVPFTYDEFDNVENYAVRITFDVILRKGGTEDEEFWHEQFTSDGVFAADSETEEEGQIRAAEQLVVDIINRTTKSW